jgi:uncharacterized DUF497 family protein
MSAMTEQFFEFDTAKSQLNLEKHGISFPDATALWADPYLLTVHARTSGESRYLAVGTIKGKVWSAIYTIRGSKIRLISVRRARRNEVELYEREDL